MKTRAPEVEILPRASRHVTWGDLRATLGRDLQEGRLVLLAYGGGRRALRLDDAIVDDGNYVLEVNGEVVTGISIHETDAVDVDAFRGQIPKELADAWQAAGQSWGVFVRPSGEWRGFAVALARMLNGDILIDPDWIEVEPGLYTPDQLEKLAA